jgi:hypothetical protein
VAQGGWWRGLAGVRARARAGGLGAARERLGAAPTARRNGAGVRRGRMSAGARAARGGGAQGARLGAGALGEWRLGAGRARVWSGTDGGRRWRVVCVARADSRRARRGDGASGSRVCRRAQA